MSAPKQLVSVIIPCYNEASSIRQVIDCFKKDSLATASFNFDILVVDNNSNDGTAQIARSAGARVIHEPKQGKGHAMRTGFLNIDPCATYALMLDGDDTYRPEEALRMLEPIYNNFCDAVVGSRLGGKIEGSSMSLLHRTGNWMFTHLVRILYRVNITDVLSGYFAWNCGLLKELTPQLRSSGFALEMEMITKMARMGCDVYAVPISYQHRQGHSSLRPVSDGLRILYMLLKNIGWQLPLSVPQTPAIVKELAKEK